MPVSGRKLTLSQRDRFGPIDECNALLTERVTLKTKFEVCHERLDVLAYLRMWLPHKTFQQAKWLFAAVNEHLKRGHETGYPSFDKKHIQF